MTERQKKLGEARSSIADALHNIKVIHGPRGYSVARNAFVVFQLIALIKLCAKDIPVEQIAHLRKACNRVMETVLNSVAQAEGPVLDSKTAYEIAAIMSTTLSSGVDHVLSDNKN